MMWISKYTYPHHSFTMIKQSIKSNRKEIFIMGKFDKLTDLIQKKVNNGTLSMESANLLNEIISTEDNQAVVEKSSTENNIPEKKTFRQQKTNNITIPRIREIKKPSLVKENADEINEKKLSAYEAYTEGTISRVELNQLLNSLK